MLALAGNGFLRLYMRAFVFLPLPHAPIVGCKVATRTEPENPANAQTILSTLEHGSQSSFPFYSKSVVDLSQGGTCDSVSVFGECSCEDGVPSPGCDPADSSTWMQAGEESDAKLAGGLSLTCVEQAAGAVVGHGGKGVGAAAPFGTSAKTFHSEWGAWLMGACMGGWRAACMAHLA